MSSRKLVRCVSTCSEDILDDALNELSHLNQRHAVLRQQLFARKNNSRMGGKYRTSSGSVCSNTSSSSSSSSSTTSSSMCSSFSSSMSATMSSSESWDSFSDCSPSGAGGQDMQSMSASIDFSGVARRLSKPKVNMYRPYCKPRRFSLQLVSHPESPETGDEFGGHSTSTAAPKPHFLSMVCPSVRCQTPPKYSRLVSEKENFGSGSGSGGSPVKVKSNPTSPSKCDLSSVLLDHTFVQFNAINDRLMANASTAGSVSGGAHCSGAVFAPQPMTTTSSGVLLIRSKSLDDLSLCSGINPFTQCQSSSSTLLPPKQSQSMATASSCDIDNVLQRISTLQV